MKICDFGQEKGNKKGRKTRKRRGKARERREGGGGKTTARKHGERGGGKRWPFENQVISWRRHILPIWAIRFNCSLFAGCSSVSNMSIASAYLICSSLYYIICVILSIR